VNQAVIRHRCESICDTRFTDFGFPHPWDCETLRSHSRNRVPLTVCCGYLLHRAGGLWRRKLSQPPQPVGHRSVPGTTLRQAGSRCCICVHFQCSMDVVHWSSGGRCDGGLCNKLCFTRTGWIQFVGWCVHRQLVTEGEATHAWAMRHTHLVQAIHALYCRVRRVDVWVGFVAAGVPAAWVQRNGRAEPVSTSVAAQTDPAVSNAC